uniref:Uncharacterized protein n=1 Tax=Lygus hesperus TaxID=30085 RepID=A0A146M8H8_LYGHE
MLRCHRCSCVLGNMGTDASDVECDGVLSSSSHSVPSTQSTPTLAVATAIVLPIPEPLFVNEAKQYTDRVPTNLRLRNKPCTVRLIVPHSTATRAVTAEILNLVVPPPNVLQLYTRVELWNPICLHCDKIFHPLCFVQHVQSLPCVGVEGLDAVDYPLLGHRFANTRGVLSILRHTCATLADCTVRTCQTGVLDFLQHYSQLTSLLDIIRHSVPLDQHSLHVHTHSILQFIPPYVFFSFSE